MMSVALGTYQERRIGIDQAQSTRSKNELLKDNLLELLLDVLAFVDEKTAQSLADKILKDGESNVESHLNKYLPRIFANLEQSRQSSAIERDFQAFPSLSPSSEVGSFASDIHLRRCESLIASILSKSEDIREWANPRPRDSDLVDSVTHLDTKRPAFKAKQDEFQRGGQLASEVMLWFPFKIESSMGSLLNRQNHGGKSGNDDHGIWLNDLKNLYKGKLLLLNEFPYLTPGFGFGLLLVRCVLGKCQTITSGQFQLLNLSNFPWNGNDSFKVESVKGGNFYVIRDWKQVLPYCVVRFNKTLAPSVIYHYLKFDSEDEAMAKTRSKRDADVDKVKGTTKAKSNLSSTLPPRSSLPTFGARPKSSAPSTSNSGPAPSSNLNLTSTDPSNVISVATRRSSRLSTTFLATNMFSSSTKKAKTSVQQTLVGKIMSNASISPFVTKMTLADIPKEETEGDSQTCMICLNSLNSPGMYANEVDGASASPVAPPGGLLRLNTCGHIYHETCLDELMANSASKDFLQCPYCKELYGTKIGTQPRNGTLVDRVLQRSLPGFSCTTIQITYNIPRGIQGPEHPSPGSSYDCPGFPRTAYLPNNEKGQKVLRLLKRAFDQRLVFTIGRSVTSGRDNVVTWNDIHHKTELHSNGEHGFPDPNYLDDVIQDLGQHGIFEA